ncbi:polyphosphate kinase 2 family protein [Mycetocola spongiae]|uniref:polyphosphate kinase 2 family protein n=1 Tax=Mycetocola spongiae TaxID=2859226 RepID=UPI001CF51E9A|nr:polyphosphate kinase 2 family protein [Mycetocola spongiae]UCR87964.1 polyphosphate kinase 2 family protein [Mycetocola spongiae]
MSFHSAAWSKDPQDTLRVGPDFDLSAVDPDSTPGFNGGKKAGRAELAAVSEDLSDLQERLFAAGTAGSTDSVLLVLQAMDTAGKGGIVRHVVGAVDPQGVQLASFKKPTPEELSHDFLWRIRKEVPAPGKIGVFDRSHYEDVLIGRVRSLAPAEEIERRYGAIVDFERELVDSGTRVIKVMLQISPETQKERLTERLNRPDKYWKFNPSDIDERAFWPAYQDAYQRALLRTSTADAPWFVVPANNKWYARVAVQHLLVDALSGINPQWPAATYDVEAEKLRLAASTV